MAIDKIRIMILSRSNAEVFSPPVALKKLRRSLKKHIVEKLRISVGPMHIIGCRKSITESQALKIRGIADCTIVKTDFGIYLADGIQKIQIFFWPTVAILHRPGRRSRKCFSGWSGQTKKRISFKERFRGRKY